MAFQTPMHALGLPQTRARSRDAMGAKEAALFRRRRAIAGVVVTALCLSVLMTWRLFMQLPPSVSMSIASPRRTLHQTLSPHMKQQEKLESENERQRNIQERQVSRGFRDDKQIVMVLTHFRDSDACAQTLVDALTNAFLSSRVHFRVFEELYLAEEQTCARRFCELKPKDCKQLLRSGQLRTQRRDASGAVGSTVAKYIAEGMVERKFLDHFYLSVDPAVVVFTDSWDLNLLKQWYNVGNDMAILSVAPKSVELQGLTNSTMLVQCSARIHSKDQDAVVEYNAPEPIPRQGAALLSPVLQTQYTEVFHFGPTHALFDVRSDPHTPLISAGQEYARATRFWTRGYDFYAPNEDVLFARYKWQEPRSLCLAAALATERSSSDSAEWTRPTAASAGCWDYQCPHRMANWSRPKCTGWARIALWRPGGGFPAWIRVRPTTSPPRTSLRSVVR